MGPARRIAVSPSGSRQPALIRKFRRVAVQTAIAYKRMSAKSSGRGGSSAEGSASAFCGPRPAELLYYGHLHRSHHHETRLPAVAAGPDAVRRNASAPRANTRRAGMGAAGLRHTRPGSATAGLSQVQQEFRYADRHI